MAIEEDIRSYLISVGTATPGLFCGPARPAGNGVPDNATFILVSGGGAPTGFMDGHDTDFRPIRLQVLTRVTSDSYKAGRDAAEVLWGKLQRAALSAASGYIRCTCAQAAPMYLGRDDQDHHRWSVNILVEQEI
jgi:hypothetical protein